MKNGRAVPLVAKLVNDLDRQFGTKQRISLGAFRYDYTKAAVEMVGGSREVCSRVGFMGYAILALMHMRLPGEIYFERVAATDFEVKYPFINRNVVERAHEAGIHVIAWAPNTRARIERALDQGVKGVLSDRIDLLKGIVLDRDPANKSLAGVSDQKNSSTKKA